MDITRHVGKINNTGTRVIVVFRTVNNDADNCLVVESDRLPEMYHDNLMTIINSNEAQDTLNLYDVLNRRVFSDGNNALQTLHERGFLRKIPVDDVVLLPIPNRPLPLRIANAEIDGNDSSKITLSEKSQEELASVQQTDNPLSQAAMLLEQASIMEADAKRKRAEAYTLDPSLKPKPGRPTMSDEEREAKRVERLAKRREKRRSEKAAAKLAEESNPSND